MIARCSCRDKRHNNDSPGHGSAEDTSVSHCNSLHKLSFGSTQLSSCVCLACVWQARVRTAMHAEWLCRQNWAAVPAFVRSRQRTSKSARTKTWQQRVRHVRHVRFFGVVWNSSMNTGRSRCSDFKEELPISQVPPRTIAPRRRKVCMKVYNHERIAEHARENWSLAAIAPARHGRSKRRAGETIQLFEPHLTLLMYSWSACGHFLPRQFQCAGLSTSTKAIWVQLRLMLCCSGVRLLSFRQACLKKATTIFRALLCMQKGPEDDVTLCWAHHGLRQHVSRCVRVARCMWFDFMLSFQVG